MSETASRRQTRKGATTIARLAFLALVLTGRMAAGDLVYDDFDDNVLDAAKWSVTTTSAEASVEETNGRLELAVTADASGEPFGANVLSTELLYGDFDIWASYSLLSWPNTNGVRLSLKVTTATNNVGVQRSSLSPWELLQYPREIYGVASTGLGAIGVTGTDNTAGWLRVRREGTAVTGYYSETAANWVTLGTYANTNVGTDPVQFGFAIHSGDYSFNPQGQTIRVAVDNMTTSVPEPSTSVLFGMGLVALVLRRKPMTRRGHRRAGRPQRTTSHTGGKLR
jgi:hypothetical protein